MIKRRPPVQFIVALNQIASHCCQQKKYVKILAISTYVKLVPKCSAIILLYRYAKTVQLACRSTVQFVLCSFVCLLAKIAFTVMLFSDVIVDNIVVKWRMVNG